MKRFAMAAICVLLFVACGGPGKNNSNTNDNTNATSNSNTNSQPPQQGFTECGSIKCQPGQYCYDPNLDDCRSGCLSNINCASDQTCEKGVAKVGNCKNKTTTQPPTDALQACKDACDKLQKCELLAVAETVGCKNDCSSLTTTEQETFSTCVKDWSCVGSSLPTCLAGIECGGRYKCPSGQTCVSGTCL